MIAELNRLVELVEERLADDIDVAEFATSSARRTTTCGACSRRWPECRCRSTSAGAACPSPRQMSWETATCSASRCGTGTDRRRPSVGRSDPCTASVPATSDETVAPFARNRAQVQPDRRRKHHHGMLHRRPTGLQTHRARRPCRSSTKASTRTSSRSSPRCPPRSTRASRY